jgi:hypothetical protein
MSESEMYKKKATDSLVLVVEFFNRPHDTGRLASVLFHLNHALEMLMKSVLLEHNYDIRKEDGRTIQLSSCISVLHGGTADDSGLDLLSEDEKTSLEEISTHRNEAMHGNTIIGEQLLYAYARSGISIFNSILNEEFNESLNDHLPNRVLPISGMPLKHLDIIYQEETEEIEELLDQGAREAARARARAIEISNRQQEGEENPPSDDEVDDILDRIEEGDDFDNIFPGVSNLRFGVEGEGPTIKLKFTKSEGQPVHQVTDTEEADDYVIGYREVNPFDRYSLGIYDLADHVEARYEGSKDITRSKVWAIVRKIGIHGDEDYHKELTTPSGDQKDSYTPKAIDRVIEAIESGEVDPQTAWETHGYHD